MLIVPLRIPWLDIIMAVDKAALKITFCPKFNDDKLVCVFRAASSYSVEEKQDIKISSTAQWPKTSPVPNTLAGPNRGAHLQQDTLRLWRLSITQQEFPCSYHRLSVEERRFDAYCALLLTTFTRHISTGSVLQGHQVSAHKEREEAIKQNPKSHT